MYNRSIELMVGLFIILGVGALAVLAFQVSGLSLKSGSDTYKVYAQFDDLGGLTIRGKVSMAGVMIGKVSSIELDKESYTALVEMELYSSVDNLTTDSTAAIQTAGLLGEKYISINVGADEEFLVEGGTIFDTQSALNIEKLIGSFASGK
jgi:phospholipid/cholesterol/gamma-HCH transport system substrate-binding protein